MISSYFGGFKVKRSHSWALTLVMSHSYFVSDWWCKYDIRSAVWPLEKERYTRMSATEWGKWIILFGVKCIISPGSYRLCLKQSSNSELALFQSPNLLHMSIYGPKYEGTPYTADVEGLQWRTRCLTCGSHLSLVEEQKNWTHGERSPINSCSPAGNASETQQPIFFEFRDRRLALCLYFLGTFSVLMLLTKYQSRSFLKNICT
jgi:hypothetical protein